MQTPDPDLVAKLVDGIDRVGTVLRNDAWSSGEGLGLTPTQAGILKILHRRGPLRLRDVAAHLGISLPTASASVDALERKGLVERVRAQSDGRALALTMTDSGRRAVEDLRARQSATATALSSLTPAEQESFLVLISKIIRGLQVARAIPIQRMCVTCRHFQPYRYRDAAAPHHCAFVNAAFGSRRLQLDCGDHENADPADQTAIWSAFENGSANLRAPNPP